MISCYNGKIQDVVRAHERIFNTVEVGILVRGNFLRWCFCQKEHRNAATESLIPDPLVGPVTASFIPLPVYPIFTDTLRPICLTPKLKFLLPD